MTSAEHNNFWLAKNAWLYALLEGLRGAGAVGLTIFVVTSLGYLVRSEQTFAECIGNALSLGLLFFVPLLPALAIWARWELWRNNRVKTK